MRLVASNFMKIDKKKKIHQPYPPQPEGAERLAEVVGLGKGKGGRCASGSCAASNGKGKFTDAQFQSILERFSRGHGFDGSSDSAKNEPVPVPKETEPIKKEPKKKEGKGQEDKG